MFENRCVNDEQKVFSTKNCLLPDEMPAMQLLLQLFPNTNKGIKG